MFSKGENLAATDYQMVRHPDMAFIETVSALMNATPGRDLCWLLTRHPEKPEYHVVLCVRQEYFDGPELDQLILDAWSNVLGFMSPGEAAPVVGQL